MKYIRNILNWLGFIKINHLKLNISKSEFYKKIISEKEKKNIKATISEDMIEGEYYPNHIKSTINKPSEKYPMFVFSIQVSQSEKETYLKVKSVMSKTYKFWGLLVLLMTCFLAIVNKISNTLEFGLSYNFVILSFIGLYIFAQILFRISIYEFYKYLKRTFNKIL